MRRALILGVTLLCCVLGVAAQAQTTSPLLDMLALVPDTPNAHELLSYIDYRAVISTRPGAPSVRSWQDWERYTSGQSQEGGLLMAAFGGVSSGPDFLNYLYSQGASYPKTVGFDFFAVDRAVAFGNPPANVVILQGSFDQNAVVQAHEARGYSATTLGDLTLLCGSAGCENGNQLDPSHIDPSNPFGGNLGRSEPVVVNDQVIASSPNYAALTASASTIVGNAPSIAENVDYRAAAEAVAASKGTLIQAMFVAPTDVGTASNVLIAANLSPSQLQKLEDQLRASFVPMPPYDLVLLADTATSTEQQALVALVYVTQDEAQAAAALFPAQMQNYQSQRVRRPFSDLLNDRGVTAITTSIFPVSTDRTVLLVTLHAPLPSAAIPTHEPRPVSSSMVYRLLVQSLYNRDLGWLATQF